jgi:hypothetical protein
MSDHLVIGGEQDGRWVAVNGSPRELQFPVLISLHHFSISTYTRRSFVCEGSEWMLYAEKDMTDSTVFERLLRNYQPKRRLSHG